MDAQIQALEQMLRAYKQRRRTVASINKSLAHLAHSAEQADLLPDQRQYLADSFKTAVQGKTS